MIDYSDKICIIGGGAAGLMAAGTALSYGGSVVVFEQTGRVGKKLAITGKGRCNLTNASSVQELMANIPGNSRFLYSAFSTFSSDDTMELFTSLGVELKVERGMRVFPVSDKAIDVVNALRRYAKDADFVFEKVTSVNTASEGFIVKTNKEYFFRKVIIATGGKSYPLTGSDGSGYRLATKLGHTVTKLKPSLIPLTSSSDICKKLQGLSLKNCAIKIYDEAYNVLYTDFGEMMFTHFGVTGPMILSASAHLRDVDISKLILSIDLKPALDEKTLDARLISDFRDNNNKDFVNALGALLPSKMIRPFIEYTGIDERRKVNSITKDERKKIVSALKNLTISLSGVRPIEEAIITSGGIDIKEIKPGSMESKIIPGLYFAGEIIDVDGYTGGFNLQIAFSTGYLAGKKAAEW